MDSRFPALLRGEKTDTIRLDEGDIEPGFLCYVNWPFEDQRVVVYVTSVEYLPLREVAGRTRDDVEQPTPEELLDRMRVYYPQITLDTVVLYVEHLTPEETRRRWSGVTPPD
ncbi:ASCH domain-containing protein [Pseudonocardia charpentierae]|uniref:ASCH domain-containing protein n=1 Tax=Pseudonocardia charpentierae TaxID=3075545 RepID=A0ABU2NGP9_9PSEU|nr:ASCH domain-containing protein [Pseudonocardia sp. DSM 45834]MDT0353059.1 hypothetical protein [Pseudonocardia sp. DSM 45834]